MAHARLIVAVFAACGWTYGCTSPCGVKLQQHVYLPVPGVAHGGLVQRDASLPCCGASVFGDIDLTSNGDLEIDLTNPNGSGIDGFITNVGCEKLFDRPYTGNAAATLCQVYIGPVRPRAVSEPKKLAPGRSRIFAQGYASNETATNISLDMGLWSNACKWNLIGP
jgi:hypothetical protein